MTDRLQQKAEQVTREVMGCFGGENWHEMASDYLRQRVAYRCALAGLTAGIAMAAEVCDERVITAYRYGNRESEQCAIAIRALAKGETQHG